MQAQHAQSGSITAAYLGVIAVWSTTPLGIVWSSQGLDYRQALFGRTVIGMLIAGMMLAALGRPLPRHRTALMTYLVSALGLMGGLMLTYWGARFVPSGLISVLYGLSPLMTGVLAALWLKEDALGPRRLLGLALAIGGLYAVFEGSLNLGKAALPGVIAVLGAVLVQSSTLVWIKRHGTQLDTVPYTFGMLGLAALLLCPLALAAGPLPQVIPMRAGLAVLYLGVFGSVAGFAMYYYVTKHLSAGTVSLVTLITPVTALILGHALNAERIPAMVWLGASLIGSGLALNQWHALKLFGAPAVGWLVDLSRQNRNRAP
jgi:drug/metabolite transporter (DMT)-like permease